MALALIRRQAISERLQCQAHPFVVDFECDEDRRHGSSSQRPVGCRREDNTKVAVRGIGSVVKPASCESVNQSIDVLIFASLMFFSWQINWNDRHDKAGRCLVYVTIDGTDFPIKEPHPFSRQWYSHKFKGPGVRYEIGVCIATGWIVWANGPYPCGEWPDLKIARDVLHGILDDGERYIADGGYNCKEALIPADGVTHLESLYMAWARARHETINQQFKQWRVIRNRFERDVRKHGLFMHSIVQIVQVGLCAGELRTYDVLETFMEPPTWPRW